MADIPKVKRNIQRMIDQGAPDADIDAYLSDEGVTIEQLQAPPPGVGKDMVKGFGSGTVQGAISIPGGFGDVGQRAEDAAQEAGNWFGLSGSGPDYILGKGTRTIMGPLFNLPTTEMLTRALEEWTGPLYEAQTVPGQYAQTAGQFLAPSMVQPGNLPSKALSWLGGALTSETAGQATKGTIWEKPARIAGGFLGSLAGGMAGQKLSGDVPKGPAQIKDLEQLQKVKNAAYDAVDNSGIRYSPQAYDNMLNGIDGDWAGMSFNPLRHDRANAFIKTLQSARGRDLTLTELDQLRQMAYRDIINGGDEANAAFGQAIVNRIDDMIDNTTPDMMAQGDSNQAAKLMKAARDANKVYRQSEKVMIKLDRADRQAAKTGKGTNQDNVLRQKTDELINESKGREFKKYPPAVQEKMDEIVMGTGGRNLARKIGMAAPTGAVSSTLMGGGGAAAGASIGGLFGGPMGAGIGGFIGGIGVPVVGQIGKNMADRGTRAAVDDLLRIIQAGGDAARAGINNPSLMKQNVLPGLMGGYAGSLTPRQRQQLSDELGGR